MIPIKKKKEPSYLIEYRKQDGAYFDGLRKEPLREALLEEQGFLCCYCMMRIDIDSCRIEHWHSRSGYPAEQLSYKNMMAACTGEEGSPNACCDVHKGNKSLIFNPADPKHQEHLQIRYLGQGEIRSQNNDFDEQLNDVLNLNCSRLKDNRKAVFSAVCSVLNKQKGKATCSFINKSLAKWREKDKKGQLKEYCGVAIYLLEKKLQRKSPA